MLPVVAGMQFLTNAFLLPYLVVRPLEETVVYEEDLDAASRLGESRVLGPLLGAVGSAAIAWGLAARPEFGDLGTRWASLIDLLSDDRLGASFVVDLVLFGLFQSFLVDDDLRRRGLEPEAAGGLRALGRFVPFYGLVGYLALRPPLSTRAEDSK